jgi:hypothetical protein
LAAGTSPPPCGILQPRVRLQARGAYLGASPSPFLHHSPRPHAPSLPVCRFPAYVPVCEPAFG